MTKFLNDDWMKNNGFLGDPVQVEQKKEAESFGTATIADLHLQPAITVNSKVSVADCMEIMNKAGIDQLPVIDEHKKILGLVTVGHMLSKLAKQTAKPTDEIASVMFHSNLKRPFVEITLKTKLADLQKFFEKNSSAVVTETENNIPVVKHVVTKVDLLKFLISNKK